MPKLAATLASLLLITCSIGVNIARYPQVGRPVEAGRPADAAQSADSALIRQQSTLVETANPDLSPPRETGIEPTKSPQVAKVTRTENTRVEKHRDPKPAIGTARPVQAVAILNVRPMVPIASLPTANSGAASDEVRRLPPVQSGVSAVTEIQSAAADGAQSYAATTTP